MAKESAARSYALGKSFTKRRSRSAQFIEAYMLQKRGLFRELLACDEQRMRAILKDWPLSSTVRGYQPPLQIGLHGLLAYPGTLLETAKEDKNQRANKTRLLIKVSVGGIIFNLICTQEGKDDLRWMWESQEFSSEHIKGEQLEALKQAIKQLVDVDIPAILAKLKKSS